MSGPDESALVRSYVITGGRAKPSRTDVDVITLIKATVSNEPLHRLNREKRSIVELCRGGALMTVAEAAGYLNLSVALTKVLVADLIDEQLITTRTAPTSTPATDRTLLEEVLNGLRARL